MSCSIFYWAYYEDKVLCDFVPTDTCHLLLGRPWLYDKRAICDNFKNTYIFVKDGVKFVLDSQTW